MGEAAVKRGVVVPLKGTRRRRIRGHATGLLVGCDERGPLVDYPGNPHGVLVARTTVSTQALVTASEAERRRPVLLVFEQERSDEPIVVGLLEPVGAGHPPTTGEPSNRALVEARIDGRRVVIDAQDELVLQCGEATIVLRRNGRVVIRGAYVETRSRGVNRIKGGTVEIN
jgi:hypothetical protein